MVYQTQIKLKDLKTTISFQAETLQAAILIMRRLGGSVLVEVTK